MNFMRLEFKTGNFSALLLKVNDLINVTKTFLPPIEEYQKYVSQIWQNNQLTNQGPLLERLDNKTVKKPQ